MSVSRVHKEIKKKCSSLRLLPLILCRVLKLGAVNISTNSEDSIFYARLENFLQEQQFSFNATPQQLLLSSVFFPMDSISTRMYIVHTLQFSETVKLAFTYTYIGYMPPGDYHLYLNIKGSNNTLKNAFP